MRVACAGSRPGRHEMMRGSARLSEAVNCWHVDVPTTSAFLHTLSAKRQLYGTLAVVG